MENIDLSCNNIEEAYKAPNLEKGLAVMELLSEAKSGKTLQEIRNELAISLTTAYRILLTLVRLGYLYFSEETKKYSLTTKMLTIGFKSAQEHNLMETVLPKMRELRDQIKESVFFGVLNNDKILVLEQSIGTHSFCFFLTPGKELELHCSAPGKAIMAHLPLDIQEKLLRQMAFTKYNKNTITDKALYLKELLKIKQDGFAIDQEEEITGAICVGAPILNMAGHPCGSIWTSGPKDRLSKKEIEKIGALIQNICLTISKELGYLPI